MDLADRMRTRRPRAALKRQTMVQPSQTQLASVGADISAYSDDGGQNVVISLSGPIAQGDALRMAALVGGLRARYPKATGSVLVLNSPGGVVGEAQSLAEGLGASGIPVYVPNGARCLAACFLIFASGKHKYVSRTAQIGLQRPVTVAGLANDYTRSFYTALADYCLRLGVPALIVDRVMKESPTEMVYLTPEELRSMDVHFLPLDLDK